MKFSKAILIFLILSTLSTKLISQELNCQVQVVHQKVTGASDELFRTMQHDIYEFLNNTHWTKHVYAPNERIECSILINVIKQPASDRFIATLQVTSRRPVYNTSYNSSMLNYKEKENNFYFNYSEGTSLEYNPNVYNSLTTTLAFYANIILGLDYDSFGMLGGTEYFQAALKLANLGQGSNERGWLPYEDQKENNRFWLAEAFSNDAYSNVRKVNYLYHRLGLDQMTENISTSRRLISDNLQTIKKTYTKKPNALVFKLFFIAKSDELVNIFKDAQTAERMLAYNTLVEMDVANLTKYEVIKNAN
ncbi:MAG: DUF4835 family protein [Bacteroidales bacterium]|nr:DUF4835 family protein [Bacteroidales bacterium]